MSGYIAYVSERKRKSWGTRTWPRVGEVWKAKRSGARWIVRDVGDKLKVQSARDVVLYNANSAIRSSKVITLASMLSNYECDSKSSDRLARRQPTLRNSRAEALESWIRELTVHLRIAAGEKIGERVEPRKTIGDTMRVATECLAWLTDRTIDPSLGVCTPEAADRYAEQDA